MLNRLLRTLSVLLLLSAWAPANEAAKIGDDTLTMPLPQGFVRYDGLNAKMDELLGRRVPERHSAPSPPAAN